MEELRLIQLVQEAQAGSRAAFGELVREFEGSVFAVVMKRLRNSAEAAEVTQEIFLRAMRKIDQLREPERFVGWLHRIAVRLSINHAVRRPPESAQSPEMFAGVGETRGSEPWEGLIASEQAVQLREGIDKLRPLDRETLMAFYFQGQSLQEMSDHFSSPVGTIKRRLHTARHRLREQLADMQPA
ncbi:RNA polymerase sigma factor [Rubinisphaera margarita]|uniref:RNA polymerase sigma factor n=1 Tax=Rubinisphaera margarita TaxID=2909586 RepID=UPI001EE80BBD|nr:sigma-70 family RNA polymerase sigma factor [Rubinisphaera margarita]MCG6156747.1 sigma-70 family RNA polymerase sigma factor [Rubinisphaera margarita]